MYNLVTNRRYKLVADKSGEDIWAKIDAMVHGPEVVPHPLVQLLMIAYGVVASEDAEGLHSIEADLDQMTVLADLEQDIVS
jgi:hypothetical protein